MFQSSNNNQNICEFPLVEESTSIPISSSHQNFQNGNDPCAHVVHVLLCYHQGGEDPEFIRKAIESLVKKLKDRRTQLDSLISAVTSGGKQPTGCVTIHRSLDGRLQVAGRKGVPHVVYARIWRWPNVNKNELQKLSICSTPSEHPDLICINPFHYDRIVSSGINSIELSSLHMDPLSRAGGEDTSGFSQSQMFSHNSGQMTTAGRCVLPTQLEAKDDHFSSFIKTTIHSGEVLATNFNVNGNVAPDKLPFLMFGPNQQPSCVVSHLASGTTISNRQLPSFNSSTNNFLPHENTTPTSTTHLNQGVGQHDLSSSMSELKSGATLSYQPSSQSATNNFWLPVPIHSQIDSSRNTFTANSLQSNTYSEQISINHNSNDDDRDTSSYGLGSDNVTDLVQNTYGVQRYNNLRYNLDQVQIPYTTRKLFGLAPEHWCTVLYYELDTQVGEAFKASRDLSEVIIDGGMDPSGGRMGRFCLGALSNVHRTQVSEKARIHIGKGIKLKTTEDGSVYLKCLSQKGVFVRSYFLDFEHGLIYGSTVHKFCSGAEKKLFDLRWAFAEMCEQRESAQMAVVAQAYAVAGIVQRVAPSLIERAGIGVDDLRRVCCTIAISFVKGWGSGYNRSSIKETPCWVEIHLHRPLQLLNFLLQKTE